MAAGIEIYNYVTNQKGSPALYSDVLANRPAAGFIGRLFISTDTFEIYRDNGTTWDLISGGGGGVNIYNSDGSLTGARTMTMANHNLTFEGGANPARLIISANNNVAKIFQFRTANVARWDFRIEDNETGGDTGSNWHLRAHNDAGAFTFNPISVTRSNGEKSFYAQENLTIGTEAIAGVFNISAGTYGAGLTFIGGNAHAAQFNNFTIANGGSFTFASSSFVGSSGNVLRLQANASGTVTMTPSTPGIRTAAVSLNQIQYNTSGSAALTYTHASIIQTLGILQLVTSGSFTVTNAYGVIINDLNEYGFPSSGAGALILTNRWGIYQDSTVDVNYLGGTTLIGTTTNAGYKLDVNGNIRGLVIRSQATVGNTNGYFQLDHPGAQTWKLGVFTDNTSTFSIGNDNGGTFASRYFNITNIGNVGIGTTTPSKKTVISAPPPTIAGDDGLTILDPATANQTYLARCGSAYTYLAVPANAGMLYANTDLSLVADSSKKLNFHTSSGLIAQFVSNGNFLVNTTTDAGQRVQINSSLRLVPTSTVPTASAGAMYYDSATNKLKLYDGTSWVDLN
jgi:hypothetical protein